ncbi:MAG: indolepyruvate ferredoxin oxidoreductase subunit alpha [Deltaproteobacteria bacterium]|nr:indolepyruvate ferredoxin oxidoreductase subunit alpha [Deltaproteobacteria bacterium]
MAERSFEKEVQMLKLGEGDEFTGEGILAITKALLESGVGYVGGYQGAPISHLMDVLADAEEILSDLDVRFEANASEAAAAAMLSASVHYPIRGAVTFKGSVGVNVASDALANLASAGVTGGALIIIGEDYGEGSSIMQERSYAFAMKSQIWMIEPRPNLQSIVKAVEQGFLLSEATNTPVMLMLGIRSCHLTGSFKTRDNKRPPFTVQQALSEPRKNISRVVLPPMSYVQEQEKVNIRWPAAQSYIRKQKLNEIFAPENSAVGIVMQGGMYNNVISVLQRLGMADLYGNADIALYVLNVTYPLINDEFLEFCSNKNAVLVIEQGQPEFIEQTFGSMLFRAESKTKLYGKNLLPMAGEYTGDVLMKGLVSFFEKTATPFQNPQNEAPSSKAQESAQAELSKSVPIRPPGFCVGCPERPIFAAMKLVEQDLGQHQIAGDIGCHLFAALPPFEIGGSTMGYGLGPASNAAFDGGGTKRSISILGDGGFWHNGLSSSIGNAVFNKSDSVIVIIDNYFSAATGGQDLPSSRALNSSKSTKHTIAEAVKGIGVSWVRQIDDTYQVEQLRSILHEALTTEYNGPKIIIASSECMLNRQRREKPQFDKMLRNKKRVEKVRFGVDEDICTGDHACIRLSGCPSLSLKKSDDPLRDDPVASIDQNCVGCGNCGEVASAAMLCPSFYRADIVLNPATLERFWTKFRQRLINWLQELRQRKRLDFQEIAP